MLLARVQSPWEFLLSSFWTIEQYATRNQLFHADLEKLVSLGKCPQLARRIYNDLEHIKEFLERPEDDEEFLDYLRIIVERLRDQWFTFQFEDDKDDPETWTLSERARSLRTKKGGEPNPAIAEYKKQLKAIAADDFEEMMGRYAGLKRALVTKQRLPSGEQSLATEATKRTRVVENSLIQHNKLYRECGKYREILTRQDELRAKQDELLREQEELQREQDQLSQENSDYRGMQAMFADMGRFEEDFPRPPTSLTETQPQQLDPTHPTGLDE